MNAAPNSCDEPAHGVEAYPPGACSWLETADASAARYLITNGFPIGSLDRFIQMVLGRV